MSRSLLLLAMGVAHTLALGGACASDPEPRPAPPVVEEEVRPTWYREGDFVTYLYQGEHLKEGDVELKERVVRQEGNVLHIEVRARRGEEERAWLQVVTDTPYNQKNNILDELYELKGEEKVKLDATDRKVIYGLYAWTLPPQVEPAGEPTQREVEVRAGPLWTTCRETVVPVTVDGKKATFTNTGCKRFLWTHGPGALIDEDGRVLWKVTVLEAGRSSSPHPVDLTGWEGFFKPAQALDDNWLTHHSLPLTSATLASVRARTVKLILADGPREAKEEDLKKLEELTCRDPAVRAWNEDRCRGLEGRTCKEGTCQYEHFGNCTGFLLGGGKLTTAAHCVADFLDDEEKKKRSAILIGQEGAAPRRAAFGAVKVGKKDFSHHWVAVEEEDVVDVAVIEVDDGGLSAWPVAPLPPEAEVVFIHGFPRVEGRSAEDQERRGYELSAGTPRYSFGKVAARNDAGLVFCNVDGNQEHWRLAERCLVGEVQIEGFKTWTGPITHGPFLGTWDSCNGYSGAPIFDLRGRLIGINATVMSPHSPQERYSTAMFQVATPVDRGFARLGLPFEAEEP